MFGDSSGNNHHGIPKGLARRSQEKERARIMSSKHGLIKAQPFACGDTQAFRKEEGPSTSRWVSRLDSFGSGTLPNFELVHVQQLLPLDRSSKLDVNLSKWSKESCPESCPSIHLRQRRVHSSLEPSYSKVRFERSIVNSVEFHDSTKEMMSKMDSQYVAIASCKFMTVKCRLSRGPR